MSAQVRKHINDLYEDLRDGHNLISLLEVLSGDTLVSLHLFIILLPCFLLVCKKKKKKQLWKTVIIVAIKY